MNKVLLERAKDRAAVFEKFLQTERDEEASAIRLAFLDRGVENSPYRTEIENYPVHLQQKPMKFGPYPRRGELPKINTTNLDFLHGDIQEACICLGRFRDDRIETVWMGKNALRNTQFWSSTKILPVLNVLGRVNGLFPDSKVEDWRVRDPDEEGREFSFVEAIADIVSYEKKIGSSNALAATFKRFARRSDLERWLIDITGNQSLEFRGDYGEEAFIQNPQLADERLQQILLSAAEETPRGENLLSAYDLTRIVSMVGWHYHLDPDARLPGVNWDGLKAVIAGLGRDTARFVDVALETLGLEEAIFAPVILSKLGHGPSQLRQAIETTYMVFVQFGDRLPTQTGQPARLRTLAMTLRGGIPIADFEDYNQESVRLDARMAAEVTEILRRVVTEELDAIA